MQEMKARENEIVELLMQGLSMKSHHTEIVYQQMDIGKIALQNPQNTWRAHHA
jgi:hypothetical protein